MSEEKRKLVAKWWISCILPAIFMLLVAQYNISITDKSFLTTYFVLSSVLRSFKYKFS